jgi:hypothetical protein
MTCGRHGLPHHVGDCEARSFRPRPKFPTFDNYAAVLRLFPSCQYQRPVFTKTGELIVVSAEG